MEPHHSSKRGAMEVLEEDRLSTLPDDILHSVLRGLPLKHAARTSVLSRRWARTWLRALASSRVLDFTDPGFARGQAPARAAATVSRCLRLHAEYGAPLDALRVALMAPSSGSADGAFGRDAVGWVTSAVARGAREVEVAVDLTPPMRVGKVPDAGDGSAALLELPGDLFLARNSLARLALGWFSLRAVAPGAAGLAGLRSLSLSHADVTDEAVQAVASNCRALEFLSLRSCSLLKSVRIAGETLRVLEIVRCPAVRELRVTAPALESFAFHGDIVYLSGGDDYDDAGDLRSAVDLGSTPALRDANLSHLGNDDLNAYHDGEHEYAYSNFLRCVTHARILTLCSVGLQHMWMQLSYDPTDYIDMTNIQELQLLMASVRDGEDDDHRDSFSSFFQLNPLPLLDRLFIRLPGHATDASDPAAAVADEVIDDSKFYIFGDDFVLDHLSFIKLVNFRGTRHELELLAFILKRSPALEQLVLVMVGEEGRAPGDEHLKAIQWRVSAMRRVSPGAHITVCRPSEDRSRNPAHTRA